MSNDNNKQPKNPESYRNQILILKTMTDGTSSKHLQVEQIMQKSGIYDEKELQRSLFILEGQKLVSPFPEGDFTSKTWFVTSEGVRALKMIQKTVQAAQA